MYQQQKTSGILTNKERAVNFLELVGSGNVKEAYHNYVSPDFIHHNPFFQGNADSLMAAMEENADKNPDKTFIMKRAIEEHEFVAVHSHVKQNSNEPGTAVVHFFGSMKMPLLNYGI